MVSSSHPLSAFADQEIHFALCHEAAVDGLNTHGGVVVATQFGKQRQQVDVLIGAEGAEKAALSLEMPVPADFSQRAER